MKVTSGAKARFMAGCNVQAKAWTYLRSKNNNNDNRVRKL